MFAPQIRWEFQYLSCFEPCYICKKYIYRKAHSSCLVFQCFWDFKRSDNRRIYWRTIEDRIQHFQHLLHYNKYTISFGATLLWHLVYSISASLRKVKFLWAIQMTECKCNKSSKLMKVGESVIWSQLLKRIMLSSDHQPCPMFLQK